MYGSVPCAAHHSRPIRFEPAAAYAMGIVLPLVEALRRKTDFSTISGYVDDFIAGGLLLYAARATSQGKPSARSGSCSLGLRSRAV